MAPSGGTRCCVARHGDGGVMALVSPGNWTHSQWFAVVAIPRPPRGPRRHVSMEDNRHCLAAAKGRLPVGVHLAAQGSAGSRIVPLGVDLVRPANCRRGRIRKGDGTRERGPQGNRRVGTSRMGASRGPAFWTPSAIDPHDRPAANERGHTSGLAYITHTTISRSAMSATLMSVSVSAEARSVAWSRSLSV